MHERVQECLQWVGLTHAADQLPSELSGGMRKRVGMARALAPGPEIILYDEPTAGLDPTNTRRIDELIMSLKERLGVTSVVITHDMASALSIADRVALVANRRIELVVAADEARTAAPDPLAAFIKGTLKE